MDEPRIRAANAADVPAITQIVDQAYRHYIARIGKPPGPMLDDYAASVLEGVAWVLEEGAAATGILVLLPATDYLLLDNIAVSPSRADLPLHGGHVPKWLADRMIRLGVVISETIVSRYRRDELLRRLAQTWVRGPCRRWRW